MITENTAVLEKTENPALNSIPVGLHFYWPGIFFRNSLQNYKPNVSLHIDCSQYEIKTASTGHEVEEILKLRHSVFYEELLHKTRPSRIWADDYDMRCNHLYVRDKSNGKIVGAYRLNSSVFNENFYLKKKFNLKFFLNISGRKLELGRACVHTHYRNTAVLRLLWKGLWEYMRHTFTRYVFGCSSINTTNRNLAAAIYNYLRKSHKTEDKYGVYPKDQYFIPDFREYVDYSPVMVEENNLEFKKLIPPLLRLYVKSGAIVCGEPALNRNMKCIDFFTLLDVNQIESKMIRMFS